MLYSKAPSGKREKGDPNKLKMPVVLDRPKKAKKVTWTLKGKPFFLLSSILAILQDSLIRTRLILNEIFQVSSVQLKKTVIMVEENV